jgi:hypothetical protein
MQFHVSLIRVNNVKKERREEKVKRRKLINKSLKDKVLSSHSININYLTEYVGNSF